MEQLIEDINERRPGPMFTVEFLATALLEDVDSAVPKCSARCLCESAHRIYAAESPASRLLSHALLLSHETVISVLSWPTTNDLGALCIPM